MEKLSIIKETQKSFKFNSWLGIADTDYISARILILSGIPTTGLSKAAEAIEKQFKIFFALYHLIEYKNDIEGKEIKGKKHNISKMFDDYNSLAPENNRLDDSCKRYVKLLEESYEKSRYPDGWKNFSFEVNIEDLDKFYIYLRNSNILNFAAEDKTRAKQFGTFLGDLYIRNMNWINKVGENNPIPSPLNLLKLRNNSFNELDIEK